MSAAFVAAKTTRLRMVTSVMVVPHRPAVLTAKMLATIDLLSNGRLTVGIGAGWMKEEFEAVGTPPFAERGAVTDEYMAAFRELWTKDDPRSRAAMSASATSSWRPSRCRSRIRRIWVGGESPPALRRVAKLRRRLVPDRHQPAASAGTRCPACGPASNACAGLVAEAGRDPRQIAVGYRIQRFGANVPAKADDGERRLFSGGPADIAGDLRAFRDLGVTAVDMSFVGERWTARSPT